MASTNKKKQQEVPTPKVEARRFSEMGHLQTYSIWSVL